MMTALSAGLCLADHPASQWGKVSHAGGHQVGHTQEERAPLEKRIPPGVHRYPWGTPVDLARVLCLLRPRVPQAVGSPCLAPRAPFLIGWSDGTPRALLGAK